MKHSFLRLALSLCTVTSAGFLATAAANDPIRIGYSFNEGTQAGMDGITDYYGVQDASFAGTWSGDTYFVPGFSGDESDFAITSDGNRLRFEADAALGTNWGSFTVETHFTIGPASGFRRLIGFEKSGTFTQIIGKSGANQLRTMLIADGDIRTDPLTEGQWYHAAIVYDVDLGTTSFYLDGELVGSGAIWPWDAPTYVYIGAAHTGGSKWNGNIDNLRITQAALSPSEFNYEGFGTDLTQPPVVPEPPAGADTWKFFWSEIELGEIQTGRGDGSDRSTLVTGINRPIGVAVDEGSSLLYWSEDGVAPNTDGDGAISRANLDGTDATTLYAAADGDAGLDNPQHIALDPEAGLIYWVDHHTGVYRAPLDGSGPVEEVYTSSENRHTNIALDLVNDYIYFGNPETGDLWRTDLDGGNFTYSAWTLTAAWGFNGLAIDPQAGRMYYTDLGAIKSADFLGGNVETLATGLATPLSVVLGPDDRVFFTERGGQNQIGTVNTDGSGQQALLTGLDNPFGLAMIQVEPSADIAFDEWRQLHFDAEELADSTISGPSAAPAGDGISNLMKYALGLGDPKTPARDLLPAAEVVGGELQLTYSRAKNATDVELVVEVSTDLVNWNAGAGYTEVVTVDDTQDPEIVTVRVLNESAERMFIRLNPVQVTE